MFARSNVLQIWRRSSVCLQGDVIGAEFHWTRWKDSRLPNQIKLKQETWCHTFFRSPGHREVIHQRFCPASHYRSSYYRNTPSWRTAPQPLSRPHWSARRAQHLSSRLNSMLVSLRVTGGDRLLIFWNSTAPSPATLASCVRKCKQEMKKKAGDDFFFAWQ